MNKNMSKTENKTEGLTLYTLQSNFSEDVTKNCGLLGGEIDANFLFLRNNDIYRGEIDEENNTLKLYRGDSDVIIVNNIRKNTQITGGYINNVTGELVLETNDNNIVITGFTTSSVFTDITIHGDGSTDNPIRLSELYKSPYLPSVKTVIDLTNNEIITDEMIETCEKYTKLAPLHNPANLACIRAAQEAFAGKPMVAVFDTTFHSTMPAKAYMYGIPYPVYEKYKNSCKEKGKNEK